MDQHRDIYGVEPIYRVLRIAHRPTDVMRPDRAIQRFVAAEPSGMSN